MKDFRKYELDENYFSVLNRISSYYLGFIAADGHITNYIRKQNHLIINIIESDREILEKIKNQLAYNGKIYNVPKNNGQNQVSIRICSNKLKNDINEYINTNNKTFDLQWCKNISDNLIIDFIRGYFDGDGCVHFNKIKLVVFV
jgi:intein-encoded DNA endonuclease-like protein